MVYRHYFGVIVHKEGARMASQPSNSREKEVVKRPNGPTPSVGKNSTEKEVMRSYH